MSHDKAEDRGSSSWSTWRLATVSRRPDTRALRSRRSCTHRSLAFSASHALPADPNSSTGECCKFIWGSWLPESFAGLQRLQGCVRTVRHGLGIASARLHTWGAHKNDERDLEAHVQQTIAEA